MVTLAHQGGWDEILMVAVPLVLVAVLLVVANRRANQELARLRADQAEDDAPELSPPPAPGRRPPP